ncbi:helix-turn-helix transcriptional regulator [Alkaliphilus sp. B6464]|uniref:helix-turn-helix transcriptional regulator n=1 Tax=Alkaliphilus sp. B6464 TaxID=2731219 RepID=UPI001BAB8837|nr:PAS domain-containing protein [Alkaliphilus sp. B6464]QUH20510.1 PAS domain-containing protein [Alkaliphilus sp. B6464]
MEKEIHPILKGIIPLIDGIAATFGKNCEVVLHEINGSKKSIVAIHNGHVTGRSLGSPMLDIGIKALTKDDNVSNILNYSNKSSNGHILKSSTMFIKDGNNNIIGCLCINIDISQFVVAQKALEELVHTNLDAEVSLEDTVSNNINDVLTNIVAQTLEATGKPVVYMNKEEKVSVVKKLNDQGAFLIKGAIDYVAKILCVSRYTVYNYLDEIRINE